MWTRISVLGGASLNNYEHLKDEDVLTQRKFTKQLMLWDAVRDLIEELEKQEILNPWQRMWYQGINVDDTEENWYVPPMPLCDYCKSRAGFKCQRNSTGPIIQACGKCRMVFHRTQNLVTVGTYHQYD